MIIRRSRPSYNLNDQTFEAPVADVYSFPSAHCARAAMLTVLCIGFYPKYRNAAMLMTLVIALSRVTMGRHYVSDALGGLLTGWLEGMAVLALPRGLSKWLRGIFP
ncbi:acidPPc domain-containing protein [Trichostrongylus colubriformis]|uniref:AcidPPc domain-containing protein n=1 Tax=Trichostrongylus colubriformis TaxID=6319 RepID=A0AAN8IDC4_TRICO